MNWLAMLPSGYNLAELIVWLLSVFMLPAFALGVWLLDRAILRSPKKREHAAHLRYYHWLKERGHG